MWGENPVDRLVTWQMANNAMGRETTQSTLCLWSIGFRVPWNHSRTPLPCGRYGEVLTLSTPCIYFNSVMSLPINWLLWFFRSFPIWLNRLIPPSGIWPGKTSAHYLMHFSLSKVAIEVVHYLRDFSTTTNWQNQSLHLLLYRVNLAMKQ